MPPLHRHFPTGGGLAEPGTLRTLPWKLDMEEEQAWGRRSRLWDQEPQGAGREHLRVHVSSTGTGVSVTGPPRRSPRSPGEGATNPSVERETTTLDFCIQQTLLPVRK